jgi:hypothetical protein
MEPVNRKIKQTRIVAPDRGCDEKEGFRINDPIAIAYTISRDTKRSPLTPEEIDQLFQ